MERREIGRKSEQEEGELSLGMGTIWESFQSGADEVLKQREKKSLRRFALEALE